MRAATTRSTSTPDDGRPRARSCGPAGRRTPSASRRAPSRRSRAVAQPHRAHAESRCRPRILVRRFLPRAGERRQHPEQQQRRRASRARRRERGHVGAPCGTNGTPSGARRTRTRMSVTARPTPAAPGDREDDAGEQLARGGRGSRRASGPSSRPRDVPRASSRFATFTHTMSRTAPTATSSTISAPQARR